MFMLDGRPLSLDVPFGHNEIQYPANWLRLATPEERAALGITEVEDPAQFDSRFYWAANIPKDLDTVKATLMMQIKVTAYSMLSPTDYKIVRQVETNEACDQDTLDARQAVRVAYAANKVLIEAATTVDQLAAIQFTWPTE